MEANQNCTGSSNGSDEHKYDRDFDLSAKDLQDRPVKRWFNGQRVHIAGYPESEYPLGTGRFPARDSE